MAEIRREMVEIHGRVLTLTNLDKPFWPEMGLTKAHLIKYYLDMAPYILPYIYNRPLVMKRYPDGIKGDFFIKRNALHTRLNGWKLTRFGIPVKLPIMWCVMTLQP